MSGDREKSLVEKKKVRAGHRSSATRMIGQLNDTLKSDDVQKLKQLKPSLAEKSSNLATFDEEMIEVTEEEQKKNKPCINQHKRIFGSHHSIN